MGGLLPSNPQIGVGGWVGSQLLGLLLPTLAAICCWQPPWQRQGQGQGDQLEQQHPHLAAAAEGQLERHLAQPTRPPRGRRHWAPDLAVHSFLASPTLRCRVVIWWSLLANCWVCCKLAAGLQAVWKLLYCSFAFWRGTAAPQCQARQSHPFWHWLGLSRSPGRQAVPGRGLGPSGRSHVSVRSIDHQVWSGLTNPCV